MKHKHNKEIKLIQHKEKLFKIDEMRSVGARIKRAVFNIRRTKIQVKRKQIAIKSALLDLQQSLRLFKTDEISARGETKFEVY